jgi:RNA polymerase sigma-70 factor (ECF subfamily)
MSKEQDDWYNRVAGQWDGAMQRIARSCEAEPERRRDVLQDMHVALWKSHAHFDGRCAERTWVYRIATNVAANHVNRERRRNNPLVSLDTIDDMPDAGAGDSLEKEAALRRLHDLIGRLRAPDSTIMTLYLEGLDAATIADVTGLTPGAIATRISRIKTLLARLFTEAPHG